MLISSLKRNKSNINFKINPLRLQMRSWILAHVRVQEQQKQRCYVTTSTPSPTTNGKGCSGSECNVTERALRSASVCVAVCWWAAAGSGQRASYFITGFQLNKICGASTSPAWFTLNATSGSGRERGENGESKERKETWLSSASCFSLAVDSPAGILNSI